MPKPTNELPFNPKPSTIIHVDLNSCFATIEQQANPFLRGHPLAVAAYTTDSGCIVAPSVEAKRLGIKTGMRVKDGKQLCPELIVLPPDPNKYRAVHLQLKKVLGTYTDKVIPKSIDEFIVDLEGAPAFHRLGIWQVCRQIKSRITSEIGDWLTVSIGIGPNRFLAKTAAGLHKPDGLDEINVANFAALYQTLKIDDLCGIKTNNTIRLNNMGVFSVWDFYTAPVTTLKAAFASILGYYWYMRLRGYEIDDVVFSRKSYGNSTALSQPLCDPTELAPILQKLVEKMSFRMRRGGYKARGVHVAVIYRDWAYWHQGETQTGLMFDPRDIYKVAFKLLCRSPYRRPVHSLAVSCFDLISGTDLQLTFLADLDKKDRFVTALDDINTRWGNYVITPARMLGTENMVPDRVAFGSIKELEELIFSTEML